MLAAMLCLTAASVGIDAGWQPLSTGGMEYIVQLSPDARELLRSGQMFQSDVPLNVQDIRVIRIVVGSEKLPRVDAPPAPGVIKVSALSAQNQPSSSSAQVFSAEEKPAAEPSRPWLPLTVACLLAFASLAAFVYLLGIHLELRRRYRKLLESSPAAR
ncbi:MAG: hypothetical protein JXB10_05505 [Pirellulales bacterium]|nr:hypothetical protein [Pirellulales bacterium]